MLYCTGFNLLYYTLLCLISVKLYFFPKFFFLLSSTDHMYTLLKYYEFWCMFRFLKNLNLFFRKKSCNSPTKRLKNLKFRILYIQSTSIKSMAMKSPELIAEFWTSPTLRKHFIISTLPKSMKFKSSRLLFCNQIPQNFFLNPKPTKVINFSTDSLPNTLKIEKKIF